MKIIELLKQLLLIAKDAKAWFRVLVFVIVATVCFVVGAIYFSKTKVKTQDCTYYIEQNKQLVGALIDIRNDLAKPTSFIQGESNFIFSSFIDTMPKKKSSGGDNSGPRTKMAGGIGGEPIQKVVNKIDSILLKYKQDSINRSKQNKQTKNL